MPGITLVKNNIELDSRQSVQFHISSASDITDKANDYYVAVNIEEAGKARTLKSDKARGKEKSTIVWNENLPKTSLRLSGKITFNIWAPSTALKRRRHIAKSETYTLEQLIEYQGRIDDRSLLAQLSLLTPTGAPCGSLAINTRSICTNTGKHNEIYLGTGVSPSRSSFASDGTDVASSVPSSSSTTLDHGSSEGPIESTDPAIQKLSLITEVPDGPIINVIAPST